MLATVRGVHFWSVISPIPTCDRVMHHTGAGLSLPFLCQGGRFSVQWLSRRATERILVAPC
ncbi:hypothetical protein J6590_095368 [Homalodisca vitripennis]|nr:hypothetical protein J6590_095368 [Homalodisca vitripennis]